MDKSVHFRINSSKVIHETIDGETVIVNLDSGNYYSLDKVGADIWECIVKNVPMHRIIETIASQYTGEREEIEKAMYQFVDEMQQENLIAINESHGYVSEAHIGPEDETEQMKERSIFATPVLHKYSDMQDLLLLDPIHEVDETGWPNVKTADT
ncbi:MAG: PqqD family peptide modification chaperone [Thermodesulfovibrionales bacterium]|jgi:transcriptional regulator of heat shock response